MRRFSEKEGVSAIEPFIKEVADVVRQLLNPSTITAVGIVGGFFWKLFSSFRALLEKQQNEYIKSIDDRIGELEKNSELTHKDLSKEILRIQLLTGIDSKRLSESETLHFFDKYKAQGGNSFVEDHVEEYLEYLRRKDTDDL